MTDSKLLINQLKGGVPSILIVDDDPNIITGLRDILEDSGYRVEVAACAEEARELLRRYTFCTMITDYSLPDDNGVDLAHEAKKKYPLLELILMSGHHPDHIREKIDADAIKFLRKPVGVSVLLTALEQSIQRQCQWLRIKRGRMANAIPAEFPLTATPRQQTASQRLLDLEPVELEMRRWGLPWVWCSVALVSFGIGWVSRASLPAVSIRFNLSALRSSLPKVPTATAPSNEPVPKTKENLQAAVPGVPHVKARAPNPLLQLSDEDPAIQISAAKTLLKENPDHPQAIAVLLARMADPFSKQRLAGIEALSTAGVSTPEAISGLAHALKDEDPSVAYAAATALGHLGKAALPALSELMQAMNYNGGSVPSVIQAAKQAIVGIGEPALPTLTAGFEDPKIKPQAQEALAVLSQNKVPASDSSPALEGVEDLPGSEQKQAAAAPTPSNPSSTR